MLPYMSHRPNGERRSTNVTDNKRNTLLIQGQLLVENSPEAQLTIGEWMDILQDVKDDLVPIQKRKVSAIFNVLTQRISHDLAA